MSEPPIPNTENFLSKIEADFRITNPCYYYLEQIDKDAQDIAFLKFLLDKGIGGEHFFHCIVTAIALSATRKIIRPEEKFYANMKPFFTGDIWSHRKHLKILFIKVCEDASEVEQSIFLRILGLENRVESIL